MQTSEEKKEYLRGYLRHGRWIARIEQEIDEIRTLKESPSFSADGMPHGNGTSDLSDYIVRLEGKEEKLREAEIKRIELYETIMIQIDKLADHDERDVLFFRYIKGWGWQKIADNMGYSRRQTLRIHGNALVDLEVPKDVTHVTFF